MIGIQTLFGSYYTTMHAKSGNRKRPHRTLHFPIIAHLFIAVIIAPYTSIHNSQEMTPSLTL